MGWDDPRTAAYYEAFCREHSRYARANRALVGHARLEPGQRVVDLAAGTGRTAEAVLERLGPAGRVVAVEPAEAMRAAGMKRLGDARVEWRATLPEARGGFDRIVCGAALWQMQPLPATLRSLADLLRPGGALCFNIPALYLLEPDEPGGGRDPWLLELPSRLMTASRFRDAAVAAGEPLDAKAIGAGLREAGLRGRSWRFRVRLTQVEYACWLKIPVLTEGMLPGLEPEERARRIDEALGSVDRESWKWERWRGWTAWKN